MELSLYTGVITKGMGWDTIFIMCEFGDSHLSSIELDNTRTN